MKYFKQLILGIFFIFILLIILNPGVKDFEENTPTYLELKKEVDDHQYKYDNVHSIGYKRIKNYLIFSIYEFQYVMTNKMRTNRYGYIDSYGTYDRAENLVQKRYIGILKNFLPLNQPSQRDLDQLALKEKQDSIIFAKMALDKEIAIEAASVEKAKQDSLNAAMSP